MSRPSPRPMLISNTATLAPARTDLKLIDVNITAALYDKRASPRTLHKSNALIFLLKTTSGYTPTSLVTQLMQSLTLKPGFKRRWPFFLFNYYWYYFVLKGYSKTFLSVALLVKVTLSVVSRKWNDNIMTTYCRPNGESAN